MQVIHSPNNANDPIQINGRDGQIRTADPSHPKRVLYQAEPRPDTIEPARGSRLEVFFSLQQHGPMRWHLNNFRCSKPE